jgi:hypothetical protein
MQSFPQLPVEDEVRLREVLMRDRFFEQALAISRTNGHNSRAKSAKRTSKT